MIRGRYKPGGPRVQRADAARNTWVPAARWQEVDCQRDPPSSVRHCISRAGWWGLGGRRRTSLVGGSTAAAVSVRAMRAGVGAGCKMARVGLPTWSTQQCAALYLCVCVCVWGGGTELVGGLFVF